MLDCVGNSEWHVVVIIVAILEGGVHGGQLAFSSEAGSHVAVSSLEVLNFHLLELLLEVVWLGFEWCDLEAAWFHLGLLLDLSENWCLWLLELLSLLSLIKFNFGIFLSLPYGSQTVIFGNPFGSFLGLKSFLLLVESVLLD